ncbi:MAG: EAL domain-containing protein, partial [Lachnospiraceae bacterium]
TEDSTRSRYIIERIVQMAHGLDIRVVCEGVERKEQVEFLRDIECDIIQGYYYSKPMPMDEYEKYLLKFEIESQA